jgi:hypothetical protein
MTDIGTFFHEGGPAHGISLICAECNGAPTEKLSDQAQFDGQVRRASLAGHPVLVGTVLDGRGEELPIRGTASHTRLWMASDGG